MPSNKILLLNFLFILSLRSLSSEAVRLRAKRQSTTTGTCPGYYNFTLGDIDVIQQRSAKHDTVYISACLVVEYDQYCITKLYGSLGKGTFNADLLFENIPIQDDQAAVFAYTIINDDHGTPINIQTTLGNATLSLAKTGVENVMQYQTQPVSEVIAQFIGVTFSKVISLLINIFGGILDLFTEGCDGWLAAGVHGFRGSDICSGGDLLNGTDLSQGTGDEELFGFIPDVICNSQPSQYDVAWDVVVSDGEGNRTPPGAYFSTASRGSPCLWWLLLVAVVTGCLV